MGEHPPGDDGVFLGEPACNMDLSSQVLHTLTNVFFTSTALMTHGYVTSLSKLFSVALPRTC
jgi:hypothetical protein